MSTADLASAARVETPAETSRVRQVQVRNFKSIGQATVDVGGLTILVGPNGAGKSNFLDALAFVSESLTDSKHVPGVRRGCSFR